MSPSSPRPWARVQAAVRPLNASERDGLRASLKRSEHVVEPIVILPDGRIIDGHHRWELARELAIPCPHVVLDRPEEEAYRMAVDLNTERRQLTPAERREAIRRALATEPRRTNVDVAREHGVSNQTVMRERAALDTAQSPNGDDAGAPRPHSKVTPEELRKALLLADEGMGPAAIAQQLGRPQTTVSGWLKRHEAAPVPPDELERRRHERRLRDRAAWARLQEVNHQALQVWQQDHGAIQHAIQDEPNLHTLADMAGDIARTQAVLLHLMADLDARLDDDQRERVQAFVINSGLGS